MPTLKTEIQVTVKALYSLLGDLGESVSQQLAQALINWGDGTGADQARTIFADKRTLAPSITEDLDLAGGGLVDPFGAVFAPTKVRLILVIASKGNTNNVVLFGDAASVLILNTPATTVNLKPGGVFLWVDPSLAGATVTPTTADIIQIANGGAGTSVDYTIVIIGTP